MLRQSRYWACFHLNENIWDNFEKFKTFRKKKWKFLKRKLKFKWKFKIKSNFKLQNIEEKTKSLKYLYKQRLFIKQKIKIFYGDLPTYQLKTIFNMLLKKTPLNVVERFFNHLESRLDVILFRLGVSKSIFHSWQLILYNKILVNNKIITSSNYNIQIGDIFRIIPNNNIIKIKSIPKYLEYNEKIQTGILIKKPTLDLIKFPFKVNYNLIFDYFKK